MKGYLRVIIGAADIGVPCVGLWIIAWDYEGSSSSSGFHSACRDAIASASFFRARLRQLYTDQPQGPAIPKDAETMDEARSRGFEPTHEPVHEGRANRGSLFRAAAGDERAAAPGGLASIFWL